MPILAPDPDVFKTAARPFCPYLGGTCDGRQCPSCDDRPDDDDFSDFDEEERR